MKRRFIRFAIVACLTVTGSLATYAFQSPDSHNKAIVTGSAATEITIRTAQGHVLSVMTLPAGVTWSIAADRTRHSPGGLFFEGHVTIRTKPNPANAAMYEALAASPLSLDVQNAEVEIRKLQ